MSGDLVGLVIVSHSGRLADGVAEVAAQMAPDVTVKPAGGLPDGGIGTDFEAVLAAVTEAAAAAGVVVLYDLGSAQMTAEMAVESLPEPETVVVVDAPLVEGAIAAAVSAQGGGDRGAVAAAARAAAGRSEVADTAEAPGSGDTVGAGPESGAQPEPGARAEITLDNEVGLHARPAALLARSIADVDADVRISLGDTDADARSVFSLMSLTARKGDTVVVTATGTQAEDAVARITALADRNFDE
ncbi:MULTISPECIES: dihydroxyacetone kinase phosphoryl donor subunit DhaM [Prauserella salsuginis group]|uniref:Phosphocarrier protein HPr n=1 Tax=Prauserella salsuginis TaxID=387889 RepID=A0ABW6G9K8_9PSEU|nr:MULTISPECIES: dihydroxyacetone kinase phosphoryl donor subunit DhaM [Prauserella salsuginis group]MCR3721605.1 PTS hybrid protein [Prauserella flava]MCR3734297.1 PTS hybrid protein [Prauserella salsuginis]